LSRSLALNRLDHTFEFCVQSYFKRRRWSITERPKRASRIGPGVAHVPGRWRRVINLQGPADRLRDEVNCVPHGHLGAASDVEKWFFKRLNGRCGLGGGHGITHEREVPRLRPIAIDENPTTFERGTKELVKRHVRALVRPVDGEVTKAHGVDSVVPAIGRAKVLGSKLCHSIR
jgi:hypothetical protein